MRGFSASLVIVFFSVASGLAAGQTSQATSPDRQAILEYQLTMTQADHLIAAMTAMTKYVVSLPDFRDRLTKSAKMTAAERLAQVEKDVAFAKANLAQLKPKMDAADGVAGR